MAIAFTAAAANPYPNPMTPPRPATPEPDKENVKPAGFNTPPPNKRSIAASFETPPKRQKTVSAAQPPSIGEQQALKRRQKLLASGRYEFVERALKLLEETVFRADEVSYTKGKFIGEGNFTEVFETNDANFVVKHLHETGIMNRLFLEVWNYWKTVQTNYSKLVELKVPVAEIKNAATLHIDFFAVQQKVRPISELEAQHLQPGAPFCEQLKTAIATCYQNKIVIEIAEKNIGFIDGPQGPFLQLVDIDEEIADNKAKDDQDVILNKTLASFGPVLAKYLDPRPAAK